ncbi:glycosyltransferase family 2 protein [Salinisphaera sp.]|uniref:glycosyltransferase family 2 protein n=1 Tax=Salinisphaera sp. TaxID=1914330 RepID=UPI002D76E62E|nr:glycosyltransferase family 2 protein [Salinisphaera sp.]HET7313164.1 glycosyltransferase family 2 protein [Salinisphaera sp.]
MPEISIVIPVYNRVRFIGDAIESILAQTVTDLELILVDDGSTDGSQARIAAYDDPRIRLLENPRNLGIAASRNRGIAQAHAPYTAFLDSDDRALPTRLEKQIAFLTRHPDHAAVGSWIRWIDTTGASRGVTKRKAADADQIAAERLFRSGLENATATARTEILRAYPHREDFRLGSDYELWARINNDYRLAALREVLVERRRHDDQASDERSPETMQWRLDVFAAQLDRLGIDYDRRDLERHYALRRMHKEGFAPGPDFLDWAEHWLDRLHHANAARQLYPEPAFSRVLGLFWAKSCWFALGELGPRALWRCLASPLRSTIAPGLRAELQTRLRLGAR